MFAYIKTENNLIIHIDGDQHIISRTDPRFDDLYESAIQNNIAKVKELLDYNTDSTEFEIVDGVLFYQGQRVNPALSARFIEIRHLHGNITPLENFIRNLYLNPLKSAREELYLFLESCDLPITLDGCFLAYKKVRSDYTDIYSGEFDNSVGSNPRMNRKDCDPDRNRTCSKGLHFCSFGYLEHYNSSEDDRIMIVKVNPKDVVAIPSDYNNQKGRACEYWVVDEYTEHSTKDEETYEDVTCNEAEVTPKKVAKKFTKIPPYKIDKNGKYRDLKGRFLPKEVVARIKSLPPRDPKTGRFIKKEKK